MREPTASIAWRLYVGQGPKVRPCSCPVSVPELPISKHQADHKDPEAQPCGWSVCAQTALTGHSPRVLDSQPQSAILVKRPVTKVFSVIAPSKTRIWHSQLGHPGHTMFRWMLPIIAGHEVCVSDANKVGECKACS